MPISATCRSSNPRGRRGYTLLEMVVVLAIMALVAGVAAVRVFALVQSWQARTQLESIEQQFAHLPVLARQRGRTIVLPPSADPDLAAAPAAASAAIDLPDGWLIRFDRPLRVRDSGLCEGAAITLEHGDRSYRRQVLAPFCQLRATDGEQAP